MNQDTGAAVGHMPMENSRATKFLLDRGARVVLFVTSTNYCVLPWCSGVEVITTAQLHSTKPELRLCAGSNPARGVSEIRDGEDL